MDTEEDDFGGFSRRKMMKASITSLFCLIRTFTAVSQALFGNYHSRWVCFFHLIGCGLYPGALYSLENAELLSKHVNRSHRAEVQHAVLWCGGWL